MYKLSTTLQTEGKITGKVGDWDIVNYIKFQKSTM